MSTRQDREADARADLILEDQFQHAPWECNACGEALTYTPYMFEPASGVWDVARTQDEPGSTSWCDESDSGEHQPERADR